MKINKIVLLSVIFLSIACSQEPREERFTMDLERKEMMVERREENRERMEMMVMWKLTEELRLTEDQAEKFFPVFHQYRDEVKAIRKELTAITSELNEKIDRGDSISDQEITEKMEKLKVLEFKKIEAREMLFTKMEGTLNNVQRFKLLGMEHQLRNDIRKEIRKQKPHNMKKQPRRKGFWN